MIYFIQVESNGPIKIGQADNPGQRLMELQVGNPYKLRLVLAVDGKRPERWYHKRFASLRMNGEWFEPDPELLAFIAAGAPENDEDGLLDVPARKGNRKRRDHWDFCGMSVDAIQRHLEASDEILAIIGGRKPLDQSELALTLFRKANPSESS